MPYSSPFSKEDIILFSLDSQPIAAANSNGGNAVRVVSSSNVIFYFSTEYASCNTRIQTYLFLLHNIYHYC